MKSTYPITMDQQLQGFFSWQTSLPSTSVTDSGSSNTMVPEPSMVSSQNYSPTSDTMASTTIMAISGDANDTNNESEGSLRCQWDNCQQVHSNPTSLYRHLCDEHIGRFRQGNRCLECRWAQCSVRTLKRDHITSHLKVHVPFRPFECEVSLHVWWFARLSGYFIFDAHGCTLMERCIDHYVIVTWHVYKGREKERGKARARASKRANKLDRTGMSGHTHAHAHTCVCANPSACLLTIGAGQTLIWILADSDGHFFSSVVEHSNALMTLKSTFDDMHARSDYLAVSSYVVKLIMAIYLDVYRVLR